MNSSSGYQTGGIVLLTMSIVFCGITIALVIPLIDRANQPLSVNQPVVVGSGQVALIPVSPEYSEFYPTKENPQLGTNQATAAGTPSRQTHNRTEQASFAQTVSDPVVVSSSQFQRPPLPPQVNSTQFYPNSGRPSAGSDTVAKPQSQSPQPGWAQPSVTVATPSAEAPTAEAPTYEAQPKPQTAAAQPQLVQGVAADKTPVVTEGNESPKFAPGQIPGGSVYAPVTVNLDTSMFSEQIRSLERRLDEAAQNQRPAAPQPVAPQPIIHQPIIQPIIQQPIAQPAPERPRRERVVRSDGRRRDDRDEDLSRIGDGLKELVSSFRDLQQQTNESLREVSRQAERQEAATQVIEAYRLALLRDAREAKAIPSPQPAKVAARTVSQDVPQFESPRVLSQKAGTPVNAMLIPKLVETPSKAEAPTDAEMPFLSLGSPETIKAAPVRTVVKPSMSARILPPQTIEQPVRLKMSPPKQIPPETPPEIEGFLPISLPLDVDSSSLSPVPDMSRQVAPVAYANTYRFKMAVADSGVAKVVPADGVCAQCGKAHGPDEPHAAKDASIVQTAAVVEPKPQAEKPSLRRDTRNAGRGMNRKIGSRHPKSELASESSKPFLKLKLPTLTKDGAEPGILHRMSSTIKQLGRSMQ